MPISNDDEKDLKEILEDINKDNGTIGEDGKIRSAPSAEHYGEEYDWEEEVEEEELSGAELEYQEMMAYVDTLPIVTEDQIPIDQDSKNELMKLQRFVGLHDSIACLVDSLKEHTNLWQKVLVKEDIEDNAYLGLGISNMITVFVIPRDENTFNDLLILAEICYPDQGSYGIGEDYIRLNQNSPGIDFFSELYDMYALDIVVFEQQIQLPLYS